MMRLHYANRDLVTLTATKSNRTDLKAKQNNNNEFKQVTTGMEAQWGLA